MLFPFLFQGLPLLKRQPGGRQLRLVRETAEPGLPQQMLFPGLPFLLAVLFPLPDRFFPFLRPLPAESGFLQCLAGGLLLPVQNVFPLLQTVDLLPGGGQGGQLRRQGSLFSGQCLGQRFQRRLRGGLLFLCFGGPLPGLFRPGAQLFPAGRGCLLYTSRCV